MLVDLTVKEFLNKVAGSDPVPGGGSIADTFNGLMSIPNLLALLLLSGTVVRLTKEFFASES